MRRLLCVKMNPIGRLGLAIGLGLLVAATPAAAAAPATDDETSQPQPAPQRSLPMPLPAQRDDGEEPREVVFEPSADPSADASQPNIALLISGASVLGAPWILSVFVTAIAGSGQDFLFPSRSGPANYSTLWPLFIPAVGPFIQLAYVNRQDHFGLSPFCDATLVVDGLIQTAGLAMLIAGAVPRHRVAGSATRDLAVAPLLAPGRSGLMVLGRF